MFPRKSWQLMSAPRRKLQSWRSFSVGNRRIQFDLTESEFSSIHLIAKASTFFRLNAEKLLNFSCQLHDEFLSISHDFAANKLQLVTLVDNFGLKFSLERIPRTLPSEQCFLNRWSVSLSFPNGVAIKALSQACVEQSWMEGKSPDVEVKRVLFENGFVVIAFADGTKKVLAFDGSVFEKSESSWGNKTSRVIIDEETTRVHQDSIASVHFLN